MYITAIKFFGEGEHLRAVMPHEKFYRPEAHCETGKAHTSSVVQESVSGKIMRADSLRRVCFDQRDGLVEYRQFSALLAEAKFNNRLHEALPRPWRSESCSSNGS